MFIDLEQQILVKIVPLILINHFELDNLTLQIPIPIFAQTKL